MTVKMAGGLFVISDKATLENVSFHGNVVNGKRVPDQFIKWACGCGHKTKVEHDAALKNAAPTARNQT
jgi:hypothetical protein